MELNKDIELLQTGKLYGGRKLNVQLSAQAKHAQQDGRSAASLEGADPHALPRIGPAEPFGIEDGAVEETLELPPN